MSVTKLRFARNKGEQGQSLPMLILMIVVIVLFVGLGIDVGFAYLTRAALSKSVDAACLAGVRNLFQGQGPAQQVALGTFDLNYTNSGVAGRDVAIPTRTAVFSTDPANNNLLLNVDASVQINTFFIRVLPNWRTMTVGAHGQSIRPKVILSLVLDRSGSMLSNGGSGALPGAVGTFIDNFIENHDRAAMSSFSYHGRVDRTMNTTFKSTIKSSANGLVFGGWTGSEQGLLRGYEQIQSVTVQPGEEVVKVIVFFTDGLANTFQEKFLCGAVTNSLNITPDPRLYDPNTGAQVSGCTIPSTLPSIDPAQGTVNTGTDCGPSGMYTEGGRRAEAMANTIRSNGGANDVLIYSIGLGSNPPFSECGIQSPAMAFLQRVANDPASTTFDPNQPQGVALVSSAANLQAAFDTIAKNILQRLTQ